MSRPKRWAAAVGKAQGALAELEEAMGELEDLRCEYEEWRDNLPENLQQSELGTKLDAVADMDLDFANLDFYAIEEAECADLPLGFGRD